MSIGLFNSAIRPSPKTHVVYNIGINNQQIHTKKYSGVPTKVFKSCAQLSKSCKKWQNSDFQSQFSMSKNILIFLKKKSLKNMILGAHFLLLKFFENFNF